MSEDASAIRCLLCGKKLRSPITEPANGDQHQVLVCGAHSDQDLRDQGLDDLWGGVDAGQSTSFFEGPARRVMGVWEQGRGGHSVHILLDDGDLITVLSLGLDTVHAARLRRSQRLLDSPIGVPKCDRDPWVQAVREGWQLLSLQSLPDGSVAARLIGHGTVVFKTEGYSWRELGDYRHFLTEEWSPSTDAHRR